MVSESTRETEGIETKAIKTATVKATANQTAVASASAKQLSSKSIHVPILTYHQIRDLPFEPDRAAFTYSVQPSEFKCQLDYLAAHGFHTITPEQMEAAIMRGAPLPSKPIMLTFDDGWVNALDAARMLHTRNMVGVFFVCPDLLKPGPGQRYLSWSDMQRLAESGMSIQSHTMSHAHLTNLSDATLADELKESRQSLEAAIGRPVRSIAFPFGEFDARVIDACHAAGYHTAFSTESRTDHVPEQALHLGRINMDYFLSLEDFIRLVERSPRPSHPAK